MDYGIIGGIGQGLQSFTAAYQQALNYQLEKSKAAALANYQQKMADVADQNSKTEKAKAYAGLLPFGSQAAYPNAEQLGMHIPTPPPAEPDQISTTQSAPSPTPDDNESKPGFIGPPKPPGLVAPKASIPSPGPGLMGTQVGPGKSGLTGLFPPGFIPSQIQGAAANELIKQRNEANLKEGETGEHYEIDPRSMTLVRSSAPLNQKGQLEVKQKYAQIASETSGMRSPNATISGQYDDRPAVKSARGSQVAMNQMIDNYRNHSPQGDASLLLNAFKIKFPNQATDVNSIEDLRNSQAVPDKWKQQMSQALSGGLDDATRDNLMRDGISTYRANVDSLRGEQQKFSKRAAANGVDDTSFLQEPAVDKTYSTALSIQKKIGNYVPPSQRANPGLLDRITGFLGGSPSAPVAKGPPPGLSFQQFQEWKKSNAK